MATDVDLADADVESPERDEVPVQGRRILSKLVRNGTALSGAVILLALCLMSLAAPLISRYDPNVINVLALNQ
jgi:hypothetical protein